MLCAALAPHLAHASLTLSDSDCGDLGDYVLSELVSDGSASVAESCSVAEALEVCDINGNGGVCAAFPECAGFTIVMDGCDGASARTSCCMIMDAKLTSGTREVPIGCMQVGPRSTTNGAQQI